MIDPREIREIIDDTWFRSWRFDLYRRSNYPEIMELAIEKKAEALKFVQDADRLIDKLRAEIEKGGCHE